MICGGGFWAPDAFQQQNPEGSLSVGFFLFLFLFFFLCTHPQTQIRAAQFDVL